MLAQVKSEQSRCALIVSLESSPGPERQQGSDSRCRRLGEEIAQHGWRRPPAGRHCLAGRAPTPPHSDLPAQSGPKLASKHHRIGLLQATAATTGGRPERVPSRPPTAPFWPGSHLGARGVRGHKPRSPLAQASRAVRQRLPGLPRPVLSRPSVHGYQAAMAQVPGPDLDACFFGSTGTLAPSWGGAPGPAATVQGLPEGDRGAAQHQPQPGAAVGTVGGRMAHANRPPRSRLPVAGPGPWAGPPAVAGSGLPGGAQPRLLQGPPPVAGAAP